MKEKKYHIRNYQPADFAGYLEFYHHVNRVRRLGLYVSPKLLSDELNFPRRSPEKNLFIAESQGKIIGFCELIPEINLGRVLANALIHPGFRRLGIGSALFDAALLRARELKADIIHMDIRKPNKPARRFLSGRGFEAVRRYRELRLNLADFRESAKAFPPFPVRPMAAGEEHRLAKIQNLSFAGSWGFHPNTVEEIIYMINQCDCSHEDVLLAFDGNHPVGYCWTRVNREANSRRKTQTARIHMMGVDPAFRGGGLGKRILLAGLYKLKSEGIEIVELTADSANLPALRLYHSVGFTLHAVIFWYERPVLSDHLLCDVLPGKPGN
jgi:mycothiol synthase